MPREEAALSRARLSFNVTPGKKFFMNSIITPQVEARNEARRLIEREVSSRHEKERSAAGRLRRFVIWMKIQKEVAEELRRKFPPHALYAQRFAR